MNKGTLLAQSFVSEVKLKKVLTQGKKLDTIKLIDT